VPVPVPGTRRIDRDGRGGEEAREYPVQPEIVIRPFPVVLFTATWPYAWSHRQDKVVRASTTSLSNTGPPLGL